MTIRESLETEVTGRCDVLVCGGGFAGISAALAAARQGAKVILLEKQFVLGGLGTAGLVTVYLPLCDGLGRQVSFGIAEELFRLSISMGCEDRYPRNWLDSADPSGRTAKDARFEVQYNPWIFAILAEQLLLRSGVTILYGSYAVGVSKDGDRIEAVLIENKSGRQAIAAKSVVDATGDCDIASFAKAPTAVFAQGNSLAAWYYSLGREGYRLNPVGFVELPDGQKDETDRACEPNAERFTGFDGAELSRMVQLSHRSTLASVQKARAVDESLIPTAITAMPQVRKTRRIVGEYTLDDAEQHKFFADSIGMIGDWRKRGPVYEIPFATLFSKDVKNLITAGRCTSVTDGMWEIMRVIPCCAVTGQAAGTAAALYDDFSKADAAALQSVLRASGVVLHEADLPRQ